MAEASICEVNMAIQLFDQMICCQRRLEDMSSGANQLIHLSVWLLIKVIKIRVLFGAQA